MCDLNAFIAVHTIVYYFDYVTFAALYLVLLLQMFYLPELIHLILQSFEYFRYRVPVS